MASIKKVLKAIRAVVSESWTTRKLLLVQQVAAGVTQLVTDECAVTRWECPVRLRASLKE